MIWQRIRLRAVATVYPKSVDGTLAIHSKSNGAVGQGNSSLKNGVMQSDVQYYRTKDTCLRKMPPELSSNLVDHEMILTGGDLMISQLDCAVAEARNCP
jgi:hypothetical protein